MSRSTEGSVAHAAAGTSPSNGMEVDESQVWCHDSMNGELTVLKAESLWHHVWLAHKAALWEINSGRVINHESHLRTEEVAFALYNAALAEKERQSCPLLGVATDGRSLLHLGEVFTEDVVGTLMCFICGCKHLRHNGYDKFGKKIRKGNIDFRPDQRMLLEHLFASGSDNTAWNYNLSYKRFKDHFGEAVVMDPHLQADVFEWKRKVVRDGQWEEAICCPEDFHPCARCEKKTDSCAPSATFPFVMTRCVYEA